MTAAGAARDGAAVPSPTPPLSLNWETRLPNYKGPGRMRR